LGEAFKTTAQTALDALKDLVTGTLLASMKEIVAAKAVAVAHVIKSVMASIPFPLNLALVGGAIAAVSALFSKIKLAEGGIVERPTYALIGERGPEAVIPLDRPGALAGALGGAGITLRQVNYFYGNISNAGDLDTISSRLAERTLDSIAKGRRY
jgi:phage-related minor tail protein